MELWRYPVVRFSIRLQQLGAPRAHWVRLVLSVHPGAILIGPQREFCRSWPHQTEITVKGNHFIQEDSPQEIGDAVRDFVAGL